MRLRILCNWTNSESITKRFINNFDYDNISNIEYVIRDDEDYDFIIMFNGHTKEEKNINWKKVILFVNEPSWGCEVFRCFLSSAKCLITHDRELFNNYNTNIYESPSIMFSQLGMLELKSGLNHYSPTNSSFFELIKNTNFEHKKHKISMVVSAKKNETVEVDNLYEYRHETVKKILNSDLDIHFYGKNWNIEDRRYKGTVEDKKDALWDYEYSICIENCDEKNYVTEKFFDCLVCNTVPIYKGASNIGEIYNKKGFLLLENIDLKNLPHSGSFQKTLLDNKQKYINDYNPLNILQKIISQLC